MSRKTSQPPQQSAQLTVSREDAEAKIRDRLEKGQALLQCAIHSEDALEEAWQNFRKWSDYNRELLTRVFTNSTIADEYNAFAAFASFINPSLDQEIDSYQAVLKAKITRLESLLERLELIPIASDIQPARQQATPRISSEQGNRIFVVHGHDETARETVARFLTQLGLAPIILHEQTNAGRTIIEKLEHHSSVDFAVVLLTPDDVGALAKTPDQLQERARQNVVLELGFFIGKLGRKRVCALHKGALELPSDVLGVAYLPMDGAGAWKLPLAKELREAGFAFDLNKAL